ncbi:uncharacterized protein PV06_04253 [Exophiala oligosperma]|uniref:Uncharacterized protein n=2 Tax=Chaetothyriales TaxID=34395 RepID=A0A0D2E5N0_9EURO|nr:uncharacterized protein PV06_04253 [Exophiala oligosperma]KAJ9636136.1 hypothetical protein H2204_005408 [Knufia peltigerae]KIW43109.1 hypothetical protein PV06_04253 [Exophiala oligosperma]
MCFYKLQTCPYPHQDPLAALTFHHEKESEWVPCDLSKPWGRLSCGKLVIEHPVGLDSSLTASHTPSIGLSGNVLGTRSGNPLEKHVVEPTKIPVKTRQSSADTIVPVGGDSTYDAAKTHDQTAPCKWCTAVIKIVALKSREVQGEARREIAELEGIMDGNPALRQLQRDIMHVEKELDVLRRHAWEMARGFLNGVEEPVDC